MPGDSDPHSYQLRWLDEVGRVDAVSPPLFAPCDADAIRQAIALADGDRAELWRGDHLVARFDRSSPRPVWSRDGG